MLLVLAAVISNACLDVPVKLGAGDAGGADAPLDAGRINNEDAAAPGNPTGSIELVGTTWLTGSTITVRFTGISRAGDPFIAIYSELSPSAVTSFRIPFAEGARATSGTHTFDLLPAGSYAVRLVYNTDQVRQELTFTVRVDSDGDRTADDEDGCASDPNKTSPGTCGCGVADRDANGDGAADCGDDCPDDPNKMGPGVCGCGTPDTDGDGDSTPDCNDACPNDNPKIAPGMCGCSTPDDNTDGDAKLNCEETCPNDPAKVAPGVCGCGVADTNTDGDAQADCLDECDNDPAKVVRGVCGCGVPEGCTPPPCTNQMLPGDALLVGEKRCSLNGKFTFTLGTDGYLRLLEGNEILWEAYQVAPMTQQPFVAAATVRLQASDGNLVASTAAVPAVNVWALGAAKANAILTVENNGSVVIREGGATTALKTIGPFADGDLLCREPRENQTMRMVCPAGQTIASFDFVSYGKPTGTCGSYALSTTSGCDVAGSRSYVEGKCLNKPNCEFRVVAPDFPFAGCAGAKNLRVAYKCSVADACPDDPAKTAPGVCGCGVADTNTDGDAQADCLDQCDNDPNKTVPGACGCGVADTNTDGDAQADCNEMCDNDPNKTAPGVCGCGIADTNTDNDAQLDCNELCDNDPLKVAPGVCGCGTADTNTDNDGQLDCNELCDNDPLKVAPGACGCGVADTNTDNDTQLDCNELCDNDPLKLTPGACGCGVADTNTDNDTQADCNEQCDTDPLKLIPGACGCGTADTDTDTDGTPDCNDFCPADPNKIAVGVCGCGFTDTDGDADLDGTPDCTDACPADPNKIAVGVCGCGVTESTADADLDGTPDCKDACPADPAKIAVGVCGCGVTDSDADADSDGTRDCLDACPADPNKIAVGVCGCGVTESTADADADGTPDCTDACPADATKIVAGVCGCGIAEGDCPPACSTQMQPGAQLTVGQKRCSANGRFKFMLGTDGYLRLLEGSSILWEAYQVAPMTQQPFVPAANVNLQASDGNLVAYTATPTAVYALGSSGANAILTVQDNASVAVQGTSTRTIGPFENGALRCREPRENQTMRMVCPVGQTISIINFASYGKPTGTCGNYAISTTAGCDIAGARSLVETRCLGQNNCEFRVVQPDFPATGCAGAKNLRVAYTCSGP